MIVFRINKLTKWKKCVQQILADHDKEPSSQAEARPNQKMASRSFTKIRWLLFFQWLPLGKKLASSRQSDNFL